MNEGDLFHSRYKLIKKIGEGGYSKVWLVEDTQSNLEMALKLYENYGSPSNGTDAFKEEFKLLYGLQHTNILCPKHYDTFEGSPYLLMTYCKKGSADNIVGKTDEIDAWKFLSEVASGMEYLHSKEIIHKDIKPHNVLISDDDQFLITDFGISYKGQSIENNIEKSIGTPAYSAPECFEKDKVTDKASDIWSLGATLFEILENKVPFGEEGGQNQKKETPITAIEKKYSKNLKDVVYQMLAYDPSQRPTAEELVELCKNKPRLTQKLDRNKKPPIVKTTDDQQGEKQEETDTKKETIIDDKDGQKKKKVLMTTIFVVMVVLIFTLGTCITLRKQKSKEVEKFPDIEMIFVEGGSFTMGCIEKHKNDCYHNETAHLVTVSSFYIGKYEITQAQWKVVMGNNPSYFKGDNHPVEKVSWNEVQEFIKQLNRLKGTKYRLPTEAEWEYAARGGKYSNNNFNYSGSNRVDLVAWIENNSNETTKPVGQKLPNQLEIYDMSGNVQEFCSDWFDQNYSFSSQNDPKGSSTGTNRVIRGGAWNSKARQARVTNRSSVAPNQNNANNIGFRLAVSIGDIE
ncbi:MAG: SUMF1/EgtB/PvdO family nonheme iron enzyme [Marinilabiliaceae bacterium]|nr:SUMF1/EgtB/PvdO family nonheme iron enzyme [Marinilabiliaceae bacterium]